MVNRALRNRLSNSPDPLSLPSSLRSLAIHKFRSSHHITLEDSEKEHVRGKTRREESVPVIHLPSSASAASPLDVIINISKLLQYITFKC